MQSQNKAVIQKISPVLNVASVIESIAWFERLGWECTFTWNRGGIIANRAMENASGPADFAGVRSGEATLLLCLDGQGKRALNLEQSGSDEGFWMSWWLATTEDVDALHATASTLGYRILQSPRDEPWGVREFHLQHPDGHVFRCSCAIS